MGETLTLTAEDGHKFSAYKATPSGTPRGGIVVVQEIFGVNQHIRKVADSFAADGYVAIAPALFDRVERGFETGYGPQDIERGRATRGKLSTDQALMDVKATVKELAKGGQKVGVVGYCFGGRVTFLVATTRRLGAAVGYYGGGIVTGRGPTYPSLIERVGQLATPWLGLFGDQDQSIPAEDVETLRARLASDAPAGVDAEVVRYAEAGHGFFNDARPQHFHQASAADAWPRTLDWFRTHL